MSGLVIVEFDDKLYFSRDNWELRYEVESLDDDNPFGPTSRILSSVNTRLILGDKEIPLMSIYDDNGVSGRLFKGDHRDIMIMVGRSKLKEPNCEGWTKFAEGCIV